MWTNVMRAHSLVVLFRTYFPFRTPVLTVLCFVVRSNGCNHKQLAYRHDKINSGLLQIYRYWRFLERGRVWDLGTKKTIYCILIEIQNEFFHLIGWEEVSTMLLLTELEVHTRNYLFRHSSRMDRTQWGPCALNVRTNISRMDRNPG